MAGSGLVDLLCFRINSVCRLRIFAIEYDQIIFKMSRYPYNGSLFDSSGGGHGGAGMSLPVDSTWFIEKSWEAIKPEGQEARKPQSCEA
jgi:hypothetical protein